MVGSFIVAALFNVTTAVVAASFAYTAAAFAINFALSAIISRLFSEDAQQPQDSGVRLQTPPSNTNPIPIVYGDALLGGTFVDAVLSIDQKTMYYVMAVSCISPNGQFSFDLKNFYYGDRLVTFNASGSVNSVAIQNGGTGYSVGNTLTVQGGTPTTAAQLVVTEVASGKITAVSVSTIGSYNYGTTPNNPAAVTGGAGTGAKFILGYTGYGPTVQALTDQAGNVDTTISNSGSLEISVYTSSAGGTITLINTSVYPTTVMGGSDIKPELRWPAVDRQMNGLAFAIVRLLYNQDAGTTSLSGITFATQHYLNASGAAKPGDVWYDYITNDKYGGAVDASFVDASSATVLNNYADESITYTTNYGLTATQARYRMNGVLDAGQTVLNNIDKIMTSCDSWMAYSAVAGKWSVIVNKAESVLYDFNDNNIVGELRVSATDITQSINVVEAKFPDRSSRDTPNFVNIETPLNLLYPNEPVNKFSVTYDLCNNSVQAQYLANRILKQAREDLIVGFSTTYAGIQVDAGDVVTVTNADYGWVSKQFRVMKVNEASLPDGSLGAKLEMVEYNYAVYFDTGIVQYNPMPNSDLASVSYFSALSAPTVTSSAPTGGIPNFNVQVYIPATGRVTYGELYYTAAAIPTATDWRLLSSAGRIDGEPTTPNTYYNFQNQVLPTGSSASATYYFAYLVGNEMARSQKSPTSASFTWTPVGAVGPAGTNGTRTAILDVYKSSVLAPTTFPSGTSTYTWATGQFTAPATLNGWSLTPPTPILGQTLWIARMVYADTLTTATTSISWTTTTALPASASGVNGTRTAFLEVYLWAATTPTTFPSGTSTYTWATGEFTAPSTPAGWSLTPGASTPGYTLYGCSVSYADGLTTSTSSVTWSTSTAYAVGASGLNGTNGANGENGITAITAYLVQSQATAAPTFTTPTSGSAVPAGWSTSTPAVAVGQVLWYIQGRFNSNTATVGGVAANTTAWTGPIAANIFQDIRSDNWNGSNPPVFGTLGTYGTAGYYIQRTTGDAYFNNGIFRADINTAGQAVFSGNNNSSINITIASVNYNIFFSAFGRAPATAPTSGQVNAGLLGYADSVGSQYPVGVFGIAANARSIGVVGKGDAIGGFFTTPTFAGNAVESVNTGGGNALYLDGKMATTNSTVVTNLNADYLDGYHATAFGNVFNTNSGAATVASSALSILGSTSTGITAAYVGTFGSGSTVTIEVQTTSPSDIRLKKEIQDTDLGLDFVNKLRPVSYKLKADLQQQKGYGFIADEVEELIGLDSSLVYYDPNWRVGDEKGFKTIHYPSYIAILTKAIQELTAEVAALKAKV